MTLGCLKETICPPPPPPFRASNLKFTALGTPADPSRNVSKTGGPSKWVVLLAGGFSCPSLESHPNKGSLKHTHTHTHTPPPRPAGFLGRPRPSVALGLAHWLIAMLDILLRRSVVSSAREKRVHARRDAHGKTCRKNVAASRI